MQKLLELKAKYKDLTGVDLAGGSKKSGGGKGAGEKGKGGGGQQKGAGGDAEKGKKAATEADTGRDVKKVTRWVVV